MSGGTALGERTAAVGSTTILLPSDKERNSAKKKQASELKKAEKRKAEIDSLYAKMYEDWSAGRITEYNTLLLLPC